MRPTKLVVIRPLRLQGVYYLLTGLWAVVHRRSFEAASGRKTDYWLVRMVGALAAAIGAVLLLGGRRREPSAETTALAVGSAVSFAAVDAVYAGRARISRAYLGDLVIEVVFLALLARSRARMRVRA